MFAYIIIRGRERRSAIDGQPQDAGPENGQPFPSPYPTSQTDGRKTAGMAGGSMS